MNGRRLLTALSLFAATATVTGVAAPKAVATSDLTLVVSAPGEQLLTDPTEIDISLAATNPIGGDGLPGFNGSYTAILPVGVILAASAIPPADSSILPDGRVAYFFENVGDIQEGSNLSLDLTVSVTAADFPVGSTVDVEAHFAANSNPRTVPDFDPVTGAFAGDTTGATPTDTSSTLIVPLTIDKANLTVGAEDEQLRGVHDHVATYQLLVTNNGVANDNAVVVDDFIPDVFEFLGCGGVDNTTDATGTNPGSPLEYPGAPALTATVAPAGPCPAPVLVESVDVVGGVISSGSSTNGTAVPASVADGVYTHVRWTLGTLTPANFAAPIDIQYQVGIPILRNVHDPTLNTENGTDPTATLDNNTGGFTTESDGSELQARNFSTVRGVYTGPVAPGFDPITDTVDDDDHVVSVEDLSIHKTAGVPDPLVQGSLIQYDLQIETSEYRNVTDAVVTDTLGDGQCPFLTGGADPEATPQSGECATPGNDPTFPFTGVTENADGTFVLVWDSSTAPVLADLPPNANETLTFFALIRTSFQENFLDQAPFNGADGVVNDVDIEGTTNLVAGIPDNPAIDAILIQDASSTGFGAQTAQIDKSISLPVAPGATLDCNAATWVRTNPDGAASPGSPAPLQGDPYAYRIGDRVCFRLGVDFLGSLNFRNARVDDFLPPGTTFEQVWQTPGAFSGTDTQNAAPTGATANNTVVVDEIEIVPSPAGDLITWTLGAQDPDTIGSPYENDLFVTNGGERFEMIVSAVITEDPVDRPTVDIKQNLQKFTSANLQNQTVSLRDNADFQVVRPVLETAKSAAPTTAVQGDAVSYTVGVTNVFAGTSSSTAPYDPDFAAAIDVSSWDLLPAGMVCADITGIALDVAGATTCTDNLLGSRSGIEFTIDRLDPQQTGTLTYTLTVPTGTPAGAALVNNTGVRQFESSATNDGDPGNDPLYIPPGNIDPSLEPSANLPTPIRSQATVNVPRPPNTKWVQSTITAPGNVSNAGFAPATDEATIGETVRYQSFTTVPAGTTLYNAIYADTLPAGLSLVSVDRVDLFDGVVTTTDISGGALGFGFVSDTTSWTLTFPARYDNVAGSGDDTITVEYTTVVDDVAGNVAGVNRVNTSRLSFESAPSGGTTTNVNSPAVTLRLVEPDPRIAKSNDAANPAVPGDEIIYTLDLTNPEATPADAVSSAYDLVVVDDVPVGITPLATSGGAAALDGGTVTGPSLSVARWDETARTLTWTSAANGGLAQLDPNASLTLDYATQLTTPTVTDVTLTNTADLTATGISGVDPGERTTYAGQSTSDVVIASASITKSVPSGQTTYAIGEIVDFEVEFTFPAGTIGYDTTVFDQLPDELSFDSFGTPAFSGPECQISDPVVTFAPPVGGSGQRIAWFFNELIADPILVATDCTVTLPYSVHVDTDGVDGSSFVNQADLVWNADDRIASNPPAMPAGFDDPASSNWARAAGPATVTLGVTEPQLEVDIDTLTPPSALPGFLNDQVPGNDTALSDDPDGTAASAPGGTDGDGGDVVPAEEVLQRVTVTNSGTADAFDTTVVVTLDPGTTPLTAPGGTRLVGAGLANGPGGAVGLWDPGTRTITYTPGLNPSLAGPLAAAGQVVLAYAAAVDDSDTLADQQDLTDAVDVARYFGVPTSEQGQPDVPTYNVTPTRGPVDPDATTIEIHFPELSVVKTPVDDASDARFDTPFTFQVVVTNSDMVATAFDVDVSDSLPTGWNYVAGSALVTSPNNAGVAIEPTGGPGGPLVWAGLDTLAPGETITIVYQTQPDSAVLAPDKATGIASTGAFAHTNTVDVAGDDASGSPTFDGGTPIADQTTQDVFIRRIDLEVTKVLSSPLPPTPIFFGGYVEYELTVTNQGPDAATGVELLDTNIGNSGALTDTILFDSVVSIDRGAFDGTTGVWTVGSVASGETLTLVVRTQMNTVDPPAAAVNALEVSAAGQFDSDSDPDNLVASTPVEDDEALVSLSPDPTTLGNFVWLDLNGDGVQDAGEPGIPDVPVVLTWTEPGGQARQLTVVTDSAGNYNVPLSFTDEITGGTTSLPINVPVTVTVDTGAPNMAGLTATDGPESDVDGGADSVSTQEIQDNAVVLPDGTTARIDVDFGYQPGPQELGNRVWWDADASGDASDGAFEYGIGGVTIDITWYGFDDAPGGGDDLTFETVTSDGTVDVDGDGSADPVGTWSSSYDPVAGAPDRNIPSGTYDVVVDEATLPAGLPIDTYDLDGGNPDADLEATAVTLALNEQRDDVDFSVTGEGVVGDTVWFDHDGDESQGAGEPGISGVTVQLTWAGRDGTFGTGDEAVLVTTTSDGTTDVDGDGTIDPAGTYRFPNLPDGEFEIEVDPAGTTLPADVTQTGDPDTTLDDTSRTALDSSVSVLEDLDQDFGYQGDLSLGDLVFYDVDANGSGVIDGGDVPLSGVDLDVTWAGNDGAFGTADDFVITVATSDGSVDVNGDGTIDPAGFYQVDGLPSGEYSVDVDTATLPAAITVPTYDFDEPGAPGAIVTPSTSRTTLAGADDLDQDFSYTSTGALGDTVWWDKNEDGVQDADEPGMAGVPLTLTSPGPDGLPGTADDLAILTSTGDGTSDVDGDGNIDAAGSYWFPNLPLDVPLTVTVIDAALPPTMPPTHDLDDTADGSVTTGTPHTATTTLTSGAPIDRDVDFGYDGPGSVGDRVWLDLNGDGVQDPGEPGLAGVSIDVAFPGPDGVFGSSDDVVETTTTSDGTTDVDGDGTIDPAGTYYVDSLPLDVPIQVTVDSVALPPELAPTGDDDGIGTPNVSVVTLDATTPIDLDQDFGYAGPGAVGDTVWYDVDADGAPDPAGQGIFDGADVPLIGIPVTVTGGGLDGTLGTTDDITVDLLTNADGEYLVTGLFYGPYEVVVDTAALPAGVTTQTYDPDVTLDAMSAVVIDATTPQDLDQDFSFTAGGAVGDTVWVDQDGDGVQGPGEPGLAGIPVTITSPGPDGLPGTTDDLLITTVTGDGTTDVDGDGSIDPAGTYFVSNLPLDVPLTITVTDAALPAGLVPAFDADGIATPHASVVTLTAAEPVDRAQDFGYNGAGSIGDTVWFDRDGLGGPAVEVAGGDTGIEGVDVTLTWTNPTGGPDMVLTTTTAADGTYLFSNLPEGDYTISIDANDLPAGLDPIFDPDGTTDLTSMTTLDAVTTSNLDQDFSFSGTGAVGDTVWLDLDADGTIDAGEDGVAGVTVTMTYLDPATGVTFEVATVTDADGGYRFDRVPAGEVTITVDPDTLPTGHASVSDLDGTPDGTTTITLAAGEERLDLDFGVRPETTVTGVIFEDTDGDGLQGPDEPGIPGVSVEITDSTGATVTVVTDVDGNYIAEDVLADEITIDVVDATVPDGVQLTTGNDPHSIDGVAGETTPADPIGYAPLTFISGTIWYDVDAAGDRDATDPELAGVVVELLDADGDVVATATTDGDGFYEFTDIPTGEYSVRVDESTLPAGLDRQTFDPDGVLDGSHQLTLTADGCPDKDFGYTGTASIADTVWVDTNGNQRTDSTERRVSGIRLTVTWAGPDGVLGTADDVQQTATSDVDGNVSVGDLPAGTYRIDLDPTSLPTGLRLTGPASVTVELAPGQSLDLDSFPLQSTAIPRTGGSPWGTVRIALSLLMVGAFLAVVAHRRRRTIRA